MLFLLRSFEQWRYTDPSPLSFDLDIERTARHGLMIARDIATDYGATQSQAHQRPLRRFVGGKHYSYREKDRTVHCIFCIQCEPGLWGGHTGDDG
jgi:hypothetical protein